MTYSDAISCLEGSHVYRVAECGPIPTSFWPSLTDALVQAARVGIATGRVVTIERTPYYPDYGAIVQPEPRHGAWLPVRRLSVHDEVIT